MIISQREARRLRKQVEALQRQIRNQRDRWSGDYIGVEIGRSILAATTAASIRTARKLGHATVAISDANGGDEVRFVALPHPSESV